jgi:hypothetical protein
MHILFGVFDGIAHRFPSKGKKKRVSPKTQL